MTRPEQTPQSTVTAETAQLLQQARLQELVGARQRIAEIQEKITRGIAPDSKIARKINEARTRREKYLELISYATRELTAYVKERDSASFVKTGAYDAVELYFSLQVYAEIEREVQVLRTAHVGEDVLSAYKHELTSACVYWIISDRSGVSILDLQSKKEIDTATAAEYACFSLEKNSLEGTSYPEYWRLNFPTLAGTALRMDINISHMLMHTAVFDAFEEEVASLLTRMKTQAKVRNVKAEVQPLIEQIVALKRQVADELLTGSELAQQLLPRLFEKWRASKEKHDDRVYVLRDLALSTNADIQRFYRELQDHMSELSGSDPVYVGMLEKLQQLIQKEVQQLGSRFIITADALSEISKDDEKQLLAEGAQEGVGQLLLEQCAKAGKQLSSLTREHFWSFTTTHVPTNHYPFLVPNVVNIRRGKSSFDFTFAYSREKRPNREEYPVVSVPIDPQNPSGEQVSIVKPLTILFDVDYKKGHISWSILESQYETAELQLFFEFLSGFCFEMLRIITAREEEVYKEKQKARAQQLSKGTKAALKGTRRQKENSSEQSLRGTEPVLLEPLRTEAPQPEAVRLQLSCTEREIDAAFDRGGIKDPGVKKRLTRILQRVMAHPELLHLDDVVDRTADTGETLYRFRFNRMYRGLVIRDRDASNTGEAVYRLYEIGKRDAIYG